MTLITFIPLSFAMLILCFGLIAIFYGSHILKPWAERFAAVAGEADSIPNRIFPILGLIGLLAILIKIAVF